MENGLLFYSNKYYSTFACINLLNICAFSFILFSSSKVLDIKCILCGSSESNLSEPHCLLSPPVVRGLKRKLTNAWRASEESKRMDYVNIAIDFGLPYLKTKMSNISLNCTVFQH